MQKKKATKNTQTTIEGSFFEQKKVKGSRRRMNVMGGSFVLFVSLRAPSLCSSAPLSLYNMAMEYTKVTYTRRPDDGITDNYRVESPWRGE